MATAYYSGAVAVVHATVKSLCISEPANPVCTDKRAFTLTLLNSVLIRDIGAPGYDSQFGNGAIDISQLFSDTDSTHTAPSTPLVKGLTYTQPITLTNSNPYDIALATCTVMSKNRTRAQTIPAFTITTLTQGSTPYGSPTINGIYTKFTFPTPIPVTAGQSTNFSYSYQPSTETTYQNQIGYSFICSFDNTATPNIEAYRSDSLQLTSTVDYPATIKNTYITFGKLRRSSRVYSSQLRRYDKIYFKNVDMKKVRLLQLYLYDYKKKGNQPFYKRYITPTVYSIRTTYSLPRRRHYKYVAKFQDKATGIIRSVAFDFYTK